MSSSRTTSYSLSERRHASKEAVVLLHGLGRSARSMAGLGKRLAAEGYDVVNLAYPSRRHAPEALMGHVSAEIRAHVREDQRLHFVTHSLGGILVRAMLAEKAPPNLGRTVMLAPPNKGSEVADLLGERQPFRWMLGPTLPRLNTRAESFPRQLPAAEFELGVIAGNRHVNPLSAALVASPNDGIVSVESTRIDGMTDFMVVNRSHTFIMYAPEVKEEVAHFLREGRFSRSETSADMGD